MIHGAVGSGLCGDTLCKVTSYSWAIAGRVNNNYNINLSSHGSSVAPGDAMVVGSISTRGYDYHFRRSRNKTKKGR